MPDAEVTPEVTPEPVVATPVEAAPEPEISFTPQIRVDTAAYDAAIDALEDSRQYIPEEELVALDAKIEAFKAKKVQAQASGEAEELANYRRQAENAALAKILKGSNVKPENLTGNTPEERLASAKLVAEAIAPYVAPKENTTDPTPEQIAAHGTPMVPGGEPIGENELAKLNESIAKGDLSGTMNNPAMKARLKKLAGGIFGVIS